MTSLKPMTWPSLGVGLAQWLLAAAFPPRCPGCEVAVEVQHNFCPACYGKLQFITDPQCSQCGLPFAVPMEAGARCPSCLANPGEYDRIRAPLVYNEASAPTIRALKFHDRYTGLGRAVRLMHRALGEDAARVDVIVPVPLHWRRLLRRRYNQSALLAFGLAELLARPCMPGLLRRVRPTPPQARLSRAERLKNMRHAFAAPQKLHAALQHKTVLLVDDVVTTGATVDACARALKHAGAAHVLVLALARTTKE